jgi:polysaccharide biosynthesis protein PelE
MRFLVPFVALATGVGLQAFALYMATWADRSFPAIAACLLIGVLIAGVPLLRLAAGPRARGPLGFRLADASVVVAFGVFLPVFGLLGLGLAVFVRATSGPRRRALGIVETEPPRLAGGPLATDQAGRFGPGSLEGIIRHSPNPDLRLRVVLACRQLPGRLAVPLLRLALRDRVDDVRLLAYAVLDGRERQIQSEIQATLSRAGASDLNAPNLPLGVRAKVAELYWELAYQGLVEGELLSFSLEQVLAQARIVLEQSPRYPRMALLAGRALILRRRFAEARPFLEEALRRGLSYEVVGPYLAEIEYENRRPNEVRQIVAGFAESARLRPGLAMIVERWM